MNWKEVTYCGLYCGLCASRRRIPQEAGKLRKLLAQEGYDLGGFDIPSLKEIFPAFWQGLNVLADEPCPTCRAGGGNPGCQIRVCAQAKGVVTCPQCSEFPCVKIGVLEHYPLYHSDARRIKEIGLEAWVEEQEERAKAGFSYTDIRHPWRKK